MTAPVAGGLSPKALFGLAADEPILSDALRLQAGFALALLRQQGPACDAPQAPESGRTSTQPLTRSGAKQQAEMHHGSTPAPLTAPGETAPGWQVSLPAGAGQAWSLQATSVAAQSWALELHVPAATGAVLAGRLPVLAGRLAGRGVCVDRLGLSATDAEPLPWQDPRGRR